VRRLRNSTRRPESKSGTVVNNIGRTTIDDSVIEWLDSALDGGVKTGSIESAVGATSSSVYFVEIERAGVAERYVLRLHTNRAWLADEPDLAEHEAAVLVQARRAGLPAPELVAWHAGDSDSPPAILMTRLPGSVEILPRDFALWTAELARKLAHVHASSLPDFTWRYRSWTHRDTLAPPLWSLQRSLWERAIDRVASDPPGEPPVFLHRDYHPMNVLWQEGRLTGIVDWVNGCIGPAGVDLSHCRLNLLFMYGVEAAEMFLAAYENCVPGYRHDPYWDIDALLGSLPDPEYYTPWREFGLPSIEQQKLRARSEEYLRLLDGRY